MAQERQRTPLQVEELTSSIREMASRMNAEFVPDDEKTQNFRTANELRQRRTGEVRS
jgi:hypothetical protein